MSQLNEKNESHTQTNIDSIARQEQDLLHRRTLSQRAGDFVAGFAGSLAFVLLHVVWVAAWILVNTDGIPNVTQFDPHPFSLLGNLVAFEAVILSSFILMRQDRMTRHADRRDHLNLQIDLIAEKEVTKLLQMVAEISAHLGLSHVAEDRELKELSQATSVEALTERLEDTLPE